LLSAFKKCSISGTENIEVSEKDKPIDIKTETQEEICSNLVRKFKEGEILRTWHKYLAFMETSNLSSRS